jgi:hypothetical protein
MLASPAQGFASEISAFVGNAADTRSLVASEQSTTDYQQKLAEYLLAREQFKIATDLYWNSAAEKRRGRSAKRRNNEPIGLDDYVLTQPPVYSGPPKPIDPSGPADEAPPPRKYIPVVADFLKSAAEFFNFVPQRPQSEIEFKRAYAAAAAAAGISREQAVRIYAFEASGNGTYDVQAGLEYPSPGARAISTALGYNQLLAANSVELMAENGDRFIEILAQRGRELSGDAKWKMEEKIAVLRKMVEFCRTVPDEWSEHEKLASTPEGHGIHALNLDVNIGPLLQVQALANSIRFARANGYASPLSAVQLEIMNLTGDGNGFDMITMPSDMRSKVPTANFFQRAGYRGNAIASRNNVVETLLAAIDTVMDRETKLQGAKDLAAAFPD